MEFAAVKEELVLVPLQSDFGPSAFQPYVLDLEATGLAESCAPKAIALVVLARQTGFLFALPELALSAEIRGNGNQAAPTDLLGPSTVAEVQVAALDDYEGGTCGFFSRHLNFVSVLGNMEELAKLTPFDYLDPSLVPDPDELVAKAQEWARSGGRPCWRGSNFTWQTMCLRLQCQDPVMCSSRQRARSWYCRRTSTLAKEEAQSPALQRVWRH